MSSAITKLKLIQSQLFAQEPYQNLEFKDTNEIEAYTGILGQERAVRAIEFGVDMRHDGYNIYAMGESGIGRTTYITHYLKEHAKQLPSPFDWAYVENFANNRSPLVLKLPAGTCSSLKQDFEKLIDSLLDTFPTAFEAPQYQQNKSQIERIFNRKYDQAIDRVEQEAIKRDIALFRESGALTFAPLQEGKAMDETEFARLPDKKREAFNNHIAELETQLNQELAELPKWKRESSDKLRKLNSKTIDAALKPLFSPLKKKYSKYEQIQKYLENMQKNLHGTVIEWMAEERAMEARDDSARKTQLADCYSPNSVVTHSKNSAAPVIFEPHPTYSNLFGRIEYTSEMGALNTSYKHICAGSLHQANGGFLIIEAAKLLEDFSVWEALKRALHQNKITIENNAADTALINTITLTPQDIPLDVKVILIGSRQIYYLLQELDSELYQMFRVLVDFDCHMERNKKTVALLARLLKGRCDAQNYPALTAQAVARLVEQSARMAENQNHLSSHIADLFNLLAEADYLRRKQNGRKITHQHIDAAIDAKEERTSRVSREIMQDMLEGSILIDTEGEAVGKINGLTVLSVGDISFGSPARITAAVYPGSQGIVDIEREVQLGQAIHSKGVMILNGYLGAKYAQHFPFAISASLAMEQSYGYIDGDSASLAELCCLISSLTQIPVKQNFAVTGSINQHGQVQIVGGVNEKIEGFFDLCVSRKLTGNQGVIIPACNTKNLMLNQRVIDAVKNNQFTIYAVNHVEEALQILMAIKPGKLTKSGTYPKGSINYRVLDRLKEMAELSKDSNS